MQPPAILERLLDLGAGRIAAMDEAGVDLQVMSLVTLGIDRLDRSTSVVRDVNDELGAAVAENPERLQGFATVALKDPDAAIAELERMAAKSGFVGVMVSGTVEGRFLDDARFLPFLEAAASLKLPVYLHPDFPPQPVKDVYFSGLEENAARALSIAGWGWHAETALHTLRMIVAGVFDRVPALQLVIGHMGEGIPFALARSSHVLSQAAPKLQRKVADTSRPIFT